MGVLVIGKLWQKHVEEGGGCGGQRWGIDESYTGLSTKDS